MWVSICSEWGWETVTMAEKNMVGDYDRNHREDKHSTRDNRNKREHKGDRTGWGHHKSTTANGQQ